MQHKLDTTKDWNKGLKLYKPAEVFKFYTPEHFKSFMRRPDEACEFDGYGKAV